MIVVLNDNEWSIDRNVGAVARYFHRIVTNEHYQHMHQRATRLIERFGGKTAVKVVRRAEEAAKSMLWPSILFEEFGLEYFGPIDGHNLPLLVETFKFLKTLDHPVLLHILTQKGRGFQPALDGQKKFHGLGPYDPETGKTPDGSPTWAELFATSLADLADKDPRIVAITAAMPNGTGLDHFRPRHPNRYFDVGIAEEHAVVFAAGMATRGFRPVCAIYSTFLQRAFDPVVHDVCLQKLPVLFCMDRAGLSGDDGPTHHGLFDIAYLRGIPGITLMAPKDEDELADMLKTALDLPGPSAIRYPRGSAAGVVCNPQPQALPIGKAEVLSDGSDVAILGLGPMISLAKDLAATSSATATPPPSSIRASSSRSTEKSSTATPHASQPSSLSKITSKWAASELPSSKPSKRWASPFPSSASAGPTSSSSTAKSTSSAPATASRSRPPSRRSSLCSLAASAAPSWLPDRSPAQSLTRSSCILLACPSASVVPLAAPLAAVARRGTRPAPGLRLFSPPG